MPEVDKQRLAKNIPEIFKAINRTAYMVRNFGFMCGYQDTKEDAEVLSDQMYNLAKQFKMLAKDYNNESLNSEYVKKYFEYIENPSVLKPPQSE